MRMRLMTLPAAPVTVVMATAKPLSSPVSLGCPVGVLSCGPRVFVVCGSAYQP